MVEKKPDKIQPDTTVRTVAKTIFKNLEKEGFNARDFIRLSTYLLEIVEAQLSNRMIVNSVSLQKTEGQSKAKESPDKNLYRKWERRVDERFSTQDVGIKAKGEAFYMKVIDISKHGLCCEISEAYLDLFEPESKYNIHVEYLNEELKVSAKVQWKRDNLIGFLVNESMEDIIRRLSLKKVAN